MLSIQRMRFVTRIGLVCGILAIPVAFLSWLLFEQIQSTVSFSAKEREGAQMLSLVWDTYQTALLEEGEDTSALRDAARKLADPEFRSRFIELGAHQQTLDEYISALASGDLNRQLISGQATIRAISDFSNMTLDPDLDTYYLMDLVVFRLPLLAGRAHLIHDTISIAGETSGSVPSELVKRAIAGEHDFGAALADVNTSLSLALEGNKDGSLKPRVQAAAASMIAASERFLSASSPFVTAVVAGKPSPEAAEILEVEEHDAQESLRALWTIANGEFDRLVKARIDGVAGSARINFAAVVVLLVFGGVSVFFIARSIARQLSDVSGTLVSLGHGELDVPIPYQDHRTEIGEMARRFVDLRNRLSEMDQMRRDRERQREETAEIERRKAESIAAFLTRTAKLIEGVTGVAHEVQRASGSLSGMADEANHQAGSVSHAAEQTAQSISGIAQSAEELASAVSSVSGQVAQASHHLEDARRNAETARADVLALASAADSIDGVMSLINEIAEQTNLLALNATIEAARAGEAGRGFAIVAAEVKELAQETAKATGDIQKKVNEIRSATTKTSESFHRIGASIGRGTDMTRDVADAIGSQTGVTGSIAQSVAHAAGSTRQVSSAIGAVRQAAGMTGTSAGELNKLSATLSEQAKALNVEVSRFVNEVRAA